MRQKKWIKWMIGSLYTFFNFMFLRVNLGTRLSDFWLELTCKFWSLKIKETTLPPNEVKMKKKTDELTILHKDGPVIINNPFRAQRNVAFFIRIHGHLPDEICGVSPLGALAPCEYREDGKAINKKNDYVNRLRKSASYRNAEIEVIAAQKIGISIRRKEK